MGDTNADVIDLLAIVARLSSLENEIQVIKNHSSELISYNLNLKKAVVKLTRRNRSQENALYDMEVDITELQQYSRCENLELGNIPGHILQNDLEKYIIDILGSINVNIQSYDIAAVHHIGKSNKNNSRNVIVRFAKRKNVILSLKNHCKLKSSNNDQYKRIFIFENLYPTYKKSLRQTKRDEE